MTKAKHAVMINRAPVLALWGAVVAERLGYEHDEALSLGKAMAGLNAQSKGRSLGIYKPPTRKEIEQARREAAREAPEVFTVPVLGRPVPVRQTDEGLRAVIRDRPVEAAGVERYLRGKFGDELPEVRKAMEELAESLSPEDLAREAYRLYERFRPAIAEGSRGWGQAGVLDLDLIRSLAHKEE